MLGRGVLDLKALKIIEFIEVCRGLAPLRARPACDPSKELVGLYHFFMDSIRFSRSPGQASSALPAAPLHERREEVYYARAAARSRGNFEKIRKFFGGRACAVPTPRGVRALCYAAAGGKVNNEFVQKSAQEGYLLLIDP